MRRTTYATAMDSIWVAQLNISDATAAQVEDRHGISVAQLRDALVAVAGLPFRWDDHPDRGRRAVLTVPIGRHVVTVVLYPSGEDAWNLGSAYRLP